MLIEDRVNKVIELLGLSGEEAEAAHRVLRHEFHAALAAEIKRSKPATVVAMSEEDAVRYRVISQLASDWVYAARQDETGGFKLEWTSGSFEQVTGHTIESMNQVGGWNRIIHPEDADQLFAPGGALMAGDPVTMDYRIVTASGEERWIRDYACPERDAVGERVVRVFGAVKDITEEITAQEALKEAKTRLEQRVGFDEARFRTVLDQAGEAILMIDPSTGGFIDFNDTACRRLGYEREELARMCVQEIEADAPFWMMPERQLELRRRPFSTVGEHRRKDGTSFPVEVVVSMRRYIGRDYLLCVARDITDRKQLEAKLAQADRLASVGVLAAGVAHEINNPLVYILNNVAFALAELPENSGELRSALREARSGAERVRDIVKDLKTFARSDEKMGPVDVRSVLDSSIKVAANEIRFRAQLVLDYAEDIPPVKANARIGQVFLNLLMNAAHAISSGDPMNNSITVKVRGRGSEVHIAITDTGGGIEPEQLQKIYDPFYTTKPVGMGTGLGLSICRNIISSLAGDIEAESTVGVGTTFRVRLPALPVESRRVRNSSSKPPPAASHSLRVLVVDDDALVARTIRRLLKAQHDVTLASGGREALALIGEHPYDVVFCDVMMPTMTGMELHQEVKLRTPELADKFVFITGGPFTPEAREMFDDVKNLCIQKPFSGADLIQVLEAAAITTEVRESARPASLAELAQAR